MSDFVKEKYITEGTVIIGGMTVPYIATSENFAIKNLERQIAASMFTFSYERTDIEDKTGRPVLFAWNGGPGCGSVFVHMGLLSPERIKCGNGYDMPMTAPYELINNDNCLLDTCDVVAIDAIGTGFARILDPASKAEFYSTEGDTRAFVSCIKQWLTAHRRWNSPVYIMGESYGTIRCAMVAGNMLFDPTASDTFAGLHVSGVILLGSALDYGQDPFRIPPDVLNLPSIAAANWYWRFNGEGDVSEFVNECDNFCYDEYLRALALGRRMPEEERIAVAEKLSYYTGYPAKKILDDDLRINIFDYPVQGLAEEGKSIGIYDSRFALARVKNPVKYDFFSDDASNAVSFPAFSAGFNALWKDRLGINNDEEYVEILGDCEKTWNFRTGTAPAVCLEGAMHRNPGLKLMFGIGIYDMLTTLGWARYCMSQFNFPEDRTWLKYYESGHMPYLGDEQAMKLEEDIKEFIRA